MTVTVKLTDSSKPAGGNGDGSAAVPGNGDTNASSKDKVSKVPKGSMPATADNAVGVVCAVVLVGTAAAAAGAMALKRREQQ